MVDQLSDCRALFKMRDDCCNVKPIMTKESIYLLMLSDRINAAGF